MSAMILLLLALPGGRGALAMPGGDDAPPAALTSPYPFDKYQGWLSSSLPDEDSGNPAITRVSGDRRSRFYYYLSNGDFRSEDGRLLAHVAGDLKTYGVRKTATSLHFFLYRRVENQLPRYDIVTLADGRGTVRRCSIDMSTLKGLVDRPDKSDAAMLASHWKYSNIVVNALQAAEPAFARDHCRVVANGTNNRRGARLQPVLRQPFPRVGDRFVPDDRGLKGGWLWGGVSNYGPGSGYCCVLQYYGENRDAIMFALVLRDNSRLVRVHRIFFVKDFVRYGIGCRIDGELAAIAVGDADWKHGRAYLMQGKITEGREPRIVEWSGEAPEGCRNYYHETPPVPG
ncbi:hypothetical protein U1839_01220 [Sphingomonas sp. RT2P30]|uniref:hypothetical protein n=1 Tax=Parasphingomonas halimpatiens TaxID=3096162 RepID=UPI002FC8D5A5